MSERLSSLLILIGGLLAVSALWYLSYLAVRADTRRRGMPDLVRKGWIVATVAMPLFGFALYLFVLILNRYLTPKVERVEPDDGNMTEIKARAAALGHDPLQQYPLPQPAWGKLDPIQTDGAQVYKTPSTIPAVYQSLQTSYTLIVLQGMQVGQQFALQHLPARIGRGPTLNINLEHDLNVSRQHAEIYEWNGMLRIRDLGSTHGTQINGIPINDQALTPGDQVAVGGTVLLVRELP